VLFYFGQMNLFLLSLTLTHSVPLSHSLFFCRKVEVLDIGFFLLLGFGEEKKIFYACLKLPDLYLSFTKT
jgi:hypothetical protein